MDENKMKDRSYPVHEDLADILGKPRYASGYTCRVVSRVLVDMPRYGLSAGEPVLLTSTMNAGFRGIEARITLLDGTSRSVSLGALELFGCDDPHDPFGEN